MREQEYHFINDEYKIDFYLPDGIVYYMEQCEQYDFNNDYGMYNSVAEPLVYSMCKNLYAKGGITKEQLEIIERRYEL